MPENMIAEVKDMTSGVETVNRLKPELNAIVNADDPAKMKEHVSQVARFLAEAQRELSVNRSEIPVDIVSNYTELVDVFKRGVTALDGSNPSAAMSDLKALAKQALDQIKKAAL
jgi:soluble cytochrome b562